eukprot:4285811-Pleurochrysis_carterae.AAC.2
MTILHSRYEGRVMWGKASRGAPRAGRFTPGAGCALRVCLSSANESNEVVIEEGRTRIRKERNTP